MNPRIRMFGYEIDAIRMPQAVETVLGWVEDGGGECRYVVTPNVDHTVMFQERADFRQTYQHAGLILADGMPVVLASRMLGKGLPERVTGADLVYRLFDAASARYAEAEVPTAANAYVPEMELAAVGAGSEYGDQSDGLPVESFEAEDSRRELRVYLLGAAPGVAERAAAAIHQRWPGVRAVGCYSPPMGFERDPAENAEILSRISEAAPDVLVVGLGAPKQELWVHKHRDALDASVALCVGAAIDFLAGEKPRAPSWMQCCGLEWFFRLASEPRRLFKRYFKDAWIFPRLVWKEWRGKSSVR